LVVDTFTVNSYAKMVLRIGRWCKLVSIGGPDGIVSLREQSFDVAMALLDQQMKHLPLFPLQIRFKNPSGRLIRYTVTEKGNSLGMEFDGELRRVTKILPGGHARMYDGGLHDGLPFQGECFVEEGAYLVGIGDMETEENFNQRTDKRVETEVNFNQRTDKRVVRRFLMEGVEPFLDHWSRNSEANSRKEFLQKLQDMDPLSACCLFRAASPCVKADRVCAIACIKRVGFWAAADNVLAAADASLQADKRLVMLAVNYNGQALQWASKKLRGDKEVVIAAIRTTPNALQFALEGLNQNADCWREIGLWAEEKKAKKSCWKACCWKEIQEERTYLRTEKATLSVRFSLHESSTTYATDFALLLKQSEYLREFETYNPNRWSKKSCDPKFTTIEHKCRGTNETCDYPESQNLVTTKNSKQKKPGPKSCWRHSFRFHLEESKATNGFMIQVQEVNDLGNGQKIETEMAEQVGLKIFRTTTTQKVVSGTDILLLEEEIQKWYASGCKNMDVQEVALRI